MSHLASAISSMVLTSANPLHPAYELLSKGIYGYFSGVPATQALVVAQLTSLGYSIDKVFDDPNTSFQALGLVAKAGNRPPVLVSQGTVDEKDAIDDANPKGVAFNEFTANKNAVKTWLTGIINDKTKNPAGLKADFTGQSSGGALSQWFASEFPELLHEAVTFQSPGISKAASKSFLNKGGKPNQITHYIVNGDLVSLGGEAFLPGTLRVGDYQTPAFDPEKFADKHIAGILNSNLPGINATVTNELSVTLDDLNKPTFTFTGQDWLDFITKIKQSDRLLGHAANSRAGIERQRVQSGNFNLLIGQITQVVSSPSSHNPYREYDIQGDKGVVIDRDRLVLDIIKLADDPNIQHLIQAPQISLDEVKTLAGIAGNILKPGDLNYAVDALKQALVIALQDRPLDRNLVALNAFSQEALGVFGNANLDRIGGDGNSIDSYFNSSGISLAKSDIFVDANELNLCGGVRNSAGVVASMNLERAA